MAVPPAHIVAFCGDIGISAATGAVMLSVMLGCAFLARQFWGALADRYRRPAHGDGGLGLPGGRDRRFLLTQDEAGLFSISAAFGFGFCGIIPSYAVAIRDLFPSSRGVWRIPLVLVHGDERHGLRQLVRRQRSTIISPITRRPSDRRLVQLLNLTSSAFWCAPVAPGIPPQRSHRLKGA